MIEIDVERLLVWTYQIQKADLYAAGVHMHALERVADGRPVQGRSADGCAAIDDRGMMGTAIDVKGHAVGGMPVHDDAAHVHGMVESLGYATERLLIEYAKAGVGARPDPGIGKLLAFFPIGEPDQPLVEWISTGEGRARVRYCPVVKVDRRGILNHNRMVYAVWWSGLAVLAHGLRAETGRLKRWSVTGPVAPATPWVIDAA